MLTTHPTLWEPVRPFSRALVVVAHPDDAEFGSAGTVARWVAMGTEVHYLVVTDGASGSADPEMQRSRLVDIRQKEQRAACERLGVSSLTFLGHLDGYLTSSIDVRRQVAREIRIIRPEVIITLNPDVRWSSWGYINHPDHRAVGDLVLHSINPAASTRLWDLTLIEEGLEPWDVAELWLSGFGDGLDRVDITDTLADKIAALQCHQSQLSGWDPTDRLTDGARTLGAEVDVEFAESFTVLRFRMLDDDGSEPIRARPPTNAKPRR